jgi:plastocyanin
MKSLKDEPTLLAVVAILLAIAALWAVSCGGGGGGAYSTPTTPSSSTSTPTPPAAGAGTASATVNIVGIAGSVAFTPNPVEAATGVTLAFKNTTSVVHHIVMDDGTVVGDVAPGASINMTVKSASGNYHCTNHPTMVGSINGATAPPPPTQDPSGGYTYDYTY